MSTADSSQALSALDALTRRLRSECPWDREQDARSIVPHTLEEAYELADAVYRGDDAKLLDELGDMLFQVLFLALLLEERGAGDLAQVAEHCRQKLIRRHPHVFGDADVLDAADVLRNWDAIKATEPGRERGVFGEVPDNLPALLYARKLQRRAASAGLYPTAAHAGAEEPHATQPAGEITAGHACRDEPRATQPAGEITAGHACRDEPHATQPASGVTAARAGVDEPRASPPASGTVERHNARDKRREVIARGDQESFRSIGERLFALVDEARLAHVDPELALRAAAQRFRETIDPKES